MSVDGAQQSMFLTSFSGSSWHTEMGGSWLYPVRGLEGVRLGCVWLLLSRALEPGTALIRATCELVPEVSLD